MMRRLQGAPVARLATVDRAGRPHLVPLVFALAGDQIYSVVDHKPKSTTDLKRLRNIAANPRVALLVDRYEDDWSQLWWIRIDGTARVIESGSEWQDAVGLLADKYPQYRSNPPVGPVIRIDIIGKTSWSAAPE